MACLLALHAPLWCLGASDPGKCSTVPIEPKKGICDGYYFTLKMCTSNTTSKGFYNNTLQMVIEEAQYKTMQLESYNNDNCTSQSAKKCKLELPSLAIVCKFTSCFRLVSILYNINLDLQGGEDPSCKGDAALDCDCFAVSSQLQVY